MPVEITWYVPNRIIMARFWGNSSPEDNSQVSPEIIRMFEQSPSPQVHVLIDDGAMVGLPGSFGQMRETASFLSHPKAGWILGAAPTNSTVNFLATFLVHFFNIKYKRFNDVNEACEFLVEIDPTLEALLPRNTPITKR